ncbi:hypothetical protein [Bradyrhizobium sp.]|uniref:hypothetical protein n=1 Tax=Bradyrhizobium sp. TaxID=376 RepID=UPI0025C3DDA1|nr:hypothetical protein [Bradyrhizobium sp.]
MTKTQYYSADYVQGYHAGLERAAKYHDDHASDCRAIAAVNSDNDLGPDCETHAIDHDVAADEIRGISQATKPVTRDPVGTRGTT